MITQPPPPSTPRDEVWELMNSMFHNSPSEVLAKLQPLATSIQTERDSLRRQVEEAKAIAAGLQRTVAAQDATLAERTRERDEAQDAGQREYTELETSSRLAWEKVSKERDQWQTVAAGLAETARAGFYGAGRMDDAIRAYDAAKHGQPKEGVNFKYTNK